MVEESIEVFFHFSWTSSQDVTFLTIAAGCRNPNRRIGQCISIYNCESLLEVVKEVNLNALELQFLQESQCERGYGRPPYVCCTSDKGYTTTPTITQRTTTTTSRPLTRVTTPRTWLSASPSPSNGLGNVLPQPPNCGHVTLGDKIYNGNDTGLDQYAWMVLLSYRDSKLKLNGINLFIYFFSSIFI